MHISMVEVPRVRRNVTEMEDFEDLRIDFLLNKKNRDQFGTQIMRKDHLRKKYNELLHVYELLNITGIERFNYLCNIKTVNEAFMKECVSIVNEFEQLRLYCNKLFRKISNTYNNKTMIIRDNWERDNIKYA